MKPLHASTETVYEKPVRAWTIEEKARAFWAKVDRSAGPDACWIWKGAVTSKWGYGCFAVATGQTRGAHKIAWLLTNGDTNDLCVLHHCDNRVCVNPKHLFLGTKTDNAQDKVRKGRDTTAKLSPDQVREVRRLLATGITQKRISEIVGVHYGVVHGVRIGRNYTWVK